MAVGRTLEVAEQEQWLDWLGTRSSDDGVTGFDAGGWPDAVWVLHSIYEDPRSTSDATWDDARHARLDAGLDSPLVIGSVSLDECSTVIGGSLGMSDPHGAGQSRVRWRELAERFSIDFDSFQFPPCFRWFPYQSWPVRFDPPDEGSLDRESLAALIDVLAGDGSSSTCLAYYSPLANGMRFEEAWMRQVAIRDIPLLVDPSEGRVGTPSNWWALDSTWMVFTDWDLWATKVSGSGALIAALEADPRLECIRWVKRPGSGGGSSL